VFVDVPVGEPLEELVGALDGRMLGSVGFDHRPRLAACATVTRPAGRGG
jgi:hypothetical protein